MKKLLVIGHTFPEPATTAAGSRMMQLLQLFLDQTFQITFTSTASVSDKSADLEYLGIEVSKIELNSSSFDTFIHELNPDIVLFDRYITEEQFGWRVAEHCPNALKILDTEDLHFLRKAREEVVKKNLHVNKANLFTETAKRELASILRCDLSLIISDVEMELLQDTFKIPSGLLYYLPLFYEKRNETSEGKLPSFEKRSGFMTVGNFLHAPNVDAVKILKTEIWPIIRRELPNEQLSIYGAYAPQQILEFHSPKEGFLVKGWVSNVSEVFMQSRVCLAPLRFGAGLKGKLLDAMYFGTPFVTTNIGAEGLFSNLDLYENITDNFSEFATKAINLYTNKKSWEVSQANGFKCIEKRFYKQLFSNIFNVRLQDVMQNLEAHRTENFIGQILLHHTTQSTKYMSKWIEEKNKE